MLMDYCVCIDFRLAMISRDLELWVQVFTVELNPEDRGLGQGCCSLVHQLPLSSGWVQIPAPPLISVFLPLSKPHLTYPWFGHNDLEHSQNLVTHIGVTLSHPATVTRDQNSLGPSEPTGCAGRGSEARGGGSMRIEGRGAGCEPARLSLSTLSERVPAVVQPCKGRRWWPHRLWDCGARLCPSPMPQSKLDPLSSGSCTVSHQQHRDAPVPAP